MSEPWPEAVVNEAIEEARKPAARLGHITRSAVVLADEVVRLREQARMDEGKMASLRTYLDGLRDGAAMLHVERNDWWRLVDVLRRKVTEEQWVEALTEVQHEAEPVPEALQAAHDWIRKRELEVMRAVIDKRRAPPP